MENLNSWVLVLYTGGTIGMVENENGALAPAPNILLKKIRQFWQMNDSDYSQRFCHLSDPPLALPARKRGRRILYRIIESKPLLDSSNMTIGDWTNIANDIKKNYEEYDGFVVLHGTDTLSYTAAALSFMLENLGKTVIVTGSQVPIFEIRSDGVDNFLASLMIAGNCIIPEVTVFFGEKLFRGNRTIKISTESDQAFDSPNVSPIATFGIDISVNSKQIFRPKSIEKFAVHSDLNQNVGLLRIFPSITAATVITFLQPPIEGVVLQSYGAGNVPDNRNDIMNAFITAAERGVIIVNCTQCLRGSVKNGLYAANQVLGDCGVIPGYDMTPEAALTKLSYVLSKTEWDLPMKRKMMMANIRGELSKDDSDENDDLSDTFDSCLNMTSPDDARAMKDIFFPAALFAAAAVGDVPKLHHWEKLGADLSLTNADLRTPLHVACAEGHFEVVESILSRGASVHIKDRYDKTPLDDAVHHNHHDIIKLLLKCGAHLSDRATGRIAEAMCQAASKGDIALLTSFLLAGASLDRQDVTGRTPLHFAALCNQVHCVKFLLDSHVNVAIRDFLGQTPADIAHLKKHEEVELLLNRRGSSTNRISQ